MVSQDRLDSEASHAILMDDIEQVSCLEVEMQGLFMQIVRPRACSSIMANGLDADVPGILHQLERECSERLGPTSEKCAAHRSISPANIMAAELTSMPWGPEHTPWLLCR